MVLRNSAEDKLAVEPSGNHMLGVVAVGKVDIGMGMEGH
jgi:hypothetical protein